MNNYYPFHYEVRFKLLVIDSKNNVRIESFTDIFTDENPLENRNKAFEAFNNYVSIFESNKCVFKNKQGNYVFSKPLYNFNNTSSNYYLLNEPEIIDSKNFQQDISVVFVVDDNIITKTILLGDYAEIVSDEKDSIEIIKNEFEIHKIASYPIEPQELINNLESIELELYRFYSIDVDKIIKTVFHFGLDYSESNEDLKMGATRTILPTPFKWITLGNYVKNDSVNSSSQDKNFDLKSIIETGFTANLGFKPNILYNIDNHRIDNVIRFNTAMYISAYLNLKGGVLIIGVLKYDQKTIIQGLNSDYSYFKDIENHRKMILLELDALINQYLGKSILRLITPRIINVDGKDLLMVVMEESPKPVILHSNSSRGMNKVFCYRENGGIFRTTDLEDIIDYVFSKKWLHK